MPKVIAVDIDYTLFTTRSEHSNEIALYLPLIFSLLWQQLHKYEGDKIFLISHRGIDETDRFLKLLKQELKNATEAESEPTSEELAIFCYQNLFKNLESLGLKFDFISTQNEPFYIKGTTLAFSSDFEFVKKAEEELLTIGRDEFKNKPAIKAHLEKIEKEEIEKFKENYHIANAGKWIQIFDAMEKTNTSFNPEKDPVILIDDSIRVRQAFEEASKNQKISHSDLTPPKNVKAVDATKPVEVAKALSLHDNAKILISNSPEAEIWTTSTPDVITQYFNNCVETSERYTGKLSTAKIFSLIGYSLYYFSSNSDEKIEQKNIAKLICFTQGFLQTKNADLNTTQTTILQSWLLACQIKSELLKLEERQAALKSKRTAIKVKAILTLHQAALEKIDKFSKQLEASVTREVIYQTAVATEQSKKILAELQEQANLLPRKIQEQPGWLSGLVELYSEDNARYLPVILQEVKKYLSQNMPESSKFQTRETITDLKNLEEINAWIAKYLQNNPAPKTTFTANFKYGKSNAPSFHEGIKQIQAEIVKALAVSNQDSKAEVPIL